MGKKECIGYASFNYADLDKHWSTTEYVFTLFQTPVSWRSILQSTINLFIMEDEHLLMMEAMKEAI